jgi:DNA gyrase inhibitor GyrI
MLDLDVELVDLEPMHVVSARGYGPEPEYEAWDTILEFANERQIDPWDTTHRFFGFNNPDPSPERAAYGYEQWMTVDEDVSAAMGLVIKDAPGGRYARVRIHGLDTIGDAWQYLVDWCDNQSLAIDTSREPCLEEVLNPIDLPEKDWDVILYLAVSEN